MKGKDGCSVSGWVGDVRILVDSLLDYKSGEPTLVHWGFFNPCLGNQFLNMFKSKKGISSPY